MNKLILNLIKLSNLSFFGRLFYFLLKFIFCIDVARGATFGKNIIFAHFATGLVVHEKTKISDNVVFYHNVTLGRADAYQDYSLSKMEGIEIDEGAVLCAGSKILCKDGILKVGKNTVIGANAVLLCSTGDNEIWAGIPAKKISNR